MESAKWDLGASIRSANVMFYMLQLIRACVALGVIVVALMASAAKAPQGTVLRGRAQGTTYSIKFWVEGDRGPERAAVRKAVAELLGRVDRQMSTWREDSEVSRFNRAPAGEWFEVSAEMATVMERALDFHRETCGTLDVTVAPLVRLWGFGPDAGKDAVRAPTDGEIAAAMARVGAQRLSVRREPPGLRKHVAGLEVDLAGIAPGYTVDRLVELLGEFGIRNAMVELGGEVRAIGVRPDGRAWRIGVESVAPGALQIVRVVPLANLALTTAGDARHVREVSGVQYTHIVDPRTGGALPFRGASVTVLSETAIEADALDTALMVMGVEAGYAWCVEHDVAALFQTRGSAAGEVVERTTPRLEKLVGEPQPQGTTAE